MTENNDNQNDDPDSRIPIGKHGLIEITLKKSFVLPFRVIMFLAAIPFLKELIEIVSSGEAQPRTFVAVKGEHWGYYAEFSKVLVISLFLPWLGTFGVKAKGEHNDGEHGNADES